MLIDGIEFIVQLHSIKVFYNVKEINLKIKSVNFCKKWL